MTATISGASTQIEDIREILRKRGIAEDAPAGCPRSTVAVREAAHGLRLSLTDPGGYAEERTARDAASAANLIDAWIQNGLSEIPLDSPAAVAPEAAAVDAPTPVSLGISAAFGVGFDASLWFGGRAQLPIRAGRFLLGPAVALQVDPPLTGESAATQSKRIGFDGTLFVSYPIALSKVDLRVGIDLGASFFAVDATDTVLVVETEMEEEDSEPEEHGTPVTATARYRTAAFFLGAHVAAVIPFTNRSALVVGLRLSTYPASDHDRRTSADNGIAQSGIPVGAVLLTVGLELGL